MMMQMPYLRKHVRMIEQAHGYTIQSSDAFGMILKNVLIFSKEWTRLESQEKNGLMKP